MIKQDQLGFELDQDCDTGSRWRWLKKMGGCGFSMRDKMTAVHGKKEEIRKSSLCKGTLSFIAGMLYALQIIVLGQQ